MSTGDASGQEWLGVRVPTRALDRTRQAFADFYEQEYAAVLVLARVLTGELETAEDLAHDAFMAALASWDRFDQPAGWVRRVVVNKARSRWRRRYAERRAQVAMAALPSTPYEMPDDTEAFWRHVRALPVRQAQAVALYYLEDWSTADVARVLGCAESTVRVHLARGRATLAQRLEVSDD